MYISSDGHASTSNMHACVHGVATKTKSQLLHTLESGSEHQLITTPLTNKRKDACQGKAKEVKATNKKKKNE